MIEIETNPWEQLNFILEDCIGINGFLYFEEKYLEIYKKFEEEKESLIAIAENEDFYSVRKRFLEVEIYNDLFIILSCAIIESWVNTFGIHLLSEKFYQKNIERQGIIEKIKVLCAIHKKFQIEDDDEVIKQIRELFDIRNHLVHPKAHKLTKENMSKYAFNAREVTNKEYLKSREVLKNVQQYFLSNGILCDRINYEI